MNHIEKFISSNAKKMTDAQMAKSLNLNVNNITYYRNKLGFKRLPIHKSKEYANQVKYIKENYKSKSDREIAEYLGISVTLTNTRRTENGFIKNSNRGGHKTSKNKFLIPHKIDPRTYDFLLHNFKKAGYESIADARCKLGIVNFNKLVRLIKNKQA